MPDKINELYVVLGINENDEEGVASYVSPATGVLTPLVGGLKRVPELLTIGKALAQVSNRELRLVKFSQRGNLERITPNERDRPEAKDN